MDQPLDHSNLQFSSMCEESESEDEQEEAAKPKRPTRSAYEKELSKLLKYSGKDWTCVTCGLGFIRAGPLKVQLVTGIRDGHFA